MPNRPPRLVEDESSEEISLEQQIDYIRAYNQALLNARDEFQGQLMKFVQDNQPNAESLDKLASVVLGYANKDSLGYFHFMNSGIDICKEAVALGSIKETTEND